MQLRVLFVRWPDDPSFMPNAYAVVDNFMEDEHGGIPDFFAAERTRLETEHGVGNVRELLVEIPDDAVFDLWAVPQVPGTVAAPEQVTQ